MKKTIYVYSIGEFNSLSDDFLKDKYIVRIHDISNKGFYKSSFENGVVQFFNDTVPLKWGVIKRFLALVRVIEPVAENYIKLSQAKELCTFITNHQGKDYVIHCTYGKSRSVAIAVFIEKNYQYIIRNKTKKEKEGLNPYVYELLMRNIGK